jgi:hypothetical protein
MLATLGGYLALLLGLAILLLPLLATELSRPRDAVWGAVVLLLGLVLVTTAERLSGAPMLGVLCGGLLIGRLGLEVGQARWRLLSPEEQQRLWSKERWQTSFSQTGAALARLLEEASRLLAGFRGWLAERRQARSSTGKRWVRPEPETTPAAGDTDEPPAAVTEVTSFVELDALIEASDATSGSEAPAEDATAEPTAAAEPADADGESAPEDDGNRAG